MDLFNTEPPKPKPKKGAYRPAEVAHFKFLQIHGHGPDGMKCKHCAHLCAKKFSKAYYKCLKFRNGQGSEATDWRINWPACGQFEPETQPHH